MTSSHENLIQVLDYIEAVEKANNAPASKIPLGDVLLRKKDSNRFPGVKFAQEASSDWLRLDRQQKTLPPPLPAHLADESSLFDDPHKPPQANDSSTLSTDKQTALDNYVKTQWEPWSENEILTRRSIAIYNKLFHLHMGGASGPDELLCGLAETSWSHEGQIFDYPLFTQSCEISLDKESSKIRINPTNRPPSFEDAFLESIGVAGASIFRQEQWKPYLQQLDDDQAELNPWFPPSQTSLVAQAASMLGPTGMVDAQALETPKATANLVATHSWVLFFRKRTNHFLLQDLENLKKKIALLSENGAPIPDATNAFVSFAPDEHKHSAPTPYRGLSSPGALNAKELFFPLPYNDEQVRIIQELDRSPGVVVQGPPGTGKTHTIANVISHYLAQGKKVLVTSKDEPALRVVKEKLPDNIRQMCVALLSGDADGARQFEESVKMIISQVARIDPEQFKADLDLDKTQIDFLHGKIASIQNDIRDCAMAQGAVHPFNGEEHTLFEITQSIMDGEALHSWLLHGLSPEQIDGALLDATETDLARLAELGQEIAGQAGLPAYAIADNIVFPSGDDLIKHSDASSAYIRADSTAAIKIPMPSDKAARDALIESGTKLAVDIDAFAVQRTADLQSIPQWMRTLDGLFSTMPSDSPKMLAMKKLHLLAPQFKALEHQRFALVADAVSIPTGADLSPEYEDAVKNLAAGRSPTSFIQALFDTSIKAIKQSIKETKLAGVAISDKSPPDTWKKVLALLTHKKECTMLSTQWTALREAIASSHVDLGKASPGQTTHWQRCVQEADQLEALVQCTSKTKKMLQQAHQFLGQLPKPQPSAPFVDIIEEIQNNLLLLANHESHQHIAILAARPDWNKLGEMGTEMSRLLNKTSLGQLTLDDRIHWDALDSEASRIRQLSSSKAEHASIGTKLAPTGLNDLAAAQALPQLLGTIENGNWKRAIVWRAWKNLIDASPEHAMVRNLFEKQRNFENELAKSYRDVVWKSTWLEVQKNCTPLVQQHLQAYLNSIQKMGKGTGIKAERHRKTAREAMQGAREAISCWIMPHWRVSETMPADVGMFDLVIVDEASQSDIWALPAILRGKKILIVGDEKQVSPSAVGVSEAQIKTLHARYLAGQPHGAQMTQDKSIYDLGRVVFAAQGIMLKEHFRCAPPIIAFSNKHFYDGEIVPLRTLKACEHIGPPLVDIFVKNGTRIGDQNIAEAWAIVDEIKAIIDDEAFAGKTIGVVTLLGNAQAQAIRELISDHFAPAVIAKRNLQAGTPPEFQGSERDIMFISMVADSKGSGLNSAEGNLQRVNVAMSRAKDRIYLVRSIETSSLNPDSISAKLIQHFRQPYNQEPADNAALRSLCESGFERDIFDFLVSKNYRVRPQFECGKFRLDFVVESENGNRVALECDGDRFHSGDKWSADMARQRVLERAGWLFWRCFASTHARDRLLVEQDLLSFLNDNGIQRLTSSTSAKASSLVEARVVEPDISRAANMIGNKKKLLRKAAVAPPEKP